MTTYSLFLLPGDGIGPEVMAEVEKVIAALGRSGAARFDLDRGPGRRRRLRRPWRPHQRCRHGQGAGSRCRAARRRRRPQMGRRALRASPPRPGSCACARTWGLYANIRPAICYPALADASSLKREVVDGLDLVIVRELTGGVYFGEPKTITDLGNGQERAVDTQVYETYEIERIGRVAFELARQRGHRLCSSEKRNVMKSGVLWNRIISAMGARDYPDVALEHQLADALGMALVRHPKRFDVIVTDNLFGDMLSDVAAMLTGSIGMLPSASLGRPRQGHRPAQGALRAGPWLGARYRRSRGSPTPSR